MNYQSPDAAAYLGRVHGLKVSSRTLAKYRTRGGGPKYHRVSATQVLYSSRDLDEWARNRLGPPAAHTAEERALGRDFPDMASARAAKGGRDE